MHDPVNAPPHYTRNADGSARAVEPIDVIEDWGLGFHEGQVLKYLARAGRKPGAPLGRTATEVEIRQAQRAAALQDLKKAVFYLQRRIIQLEELAPPAEAAP